MIDLSSILIELATFTIVRIGNNIPVFTFKISVVALSCSRPSGTIITTCESAGKPITHQICLFVEISLMIHIVFTIRKIVSIQELEVATLMLKSTFTVGLVSCQLCWTQVWIEIIVITVVTLHFISLSFVFEFVFFMIDLFFKVLLIGGSTLGQLA